MRKSSGDERPRGLEEYLELHYPILLEDDDGAVLASHPDLPGCMAEADTTEDAVRQLKESRRMWIATRLEDGLDIPEPMGEAFSGKTVVRMSRSLHGSLARLAAEQRVSLNALMVEALSAHVAKSATTRQFEKVRDEMLSLLGKTHQRFSIPSDIPRLQSFFSSQNGSWWIFPLGTKPSTKIEPASMTATFRAGRDALAEVVPFEHTRKVAG